MPASKRDAAPPIFHPHPVFIPQMGKKGDGVAG
jgi:hypothetical protein